MSDLPARLVAFALGYLASCVLMAILVLRREDRRRATPTPLRRIHPRYARHASPHPRQHAVLWVEAEDDRSAWRALEAGR